MNKTIDLVVAGNLGLDITPTFRDSGARAITDILAPGTLVNVGPAAITLGGPVANVGLAARHFGLRTVLMAHIATDLYGSIVMKLLEQAGVEHEMTQTDGGHTPYTVAIAPPGIDRMFLHCPGKNDEFGAANINFDTVGQARVFHLGYPTQMQGLYENNGAALIEIYQRAKDCGAVTALDLSLPDPQNPAGKVDWEKIAAKLFPYVDILLPSIEEIYSALDREAYLRLKAAHPGEPLTEHIPARDFQKLAAESLAYGCGICVFKAARRGIYLRAGSAARLVQFGEAARPVAALWADQELWAPAYHAEKIISATGSGVAAIAGFLAAYLQGKSPAHCLRLANAAGHKSLQAADGVSALPGWEALNVFVESSPVQDDPLLEGTPFRYNDSDKVYRLNADGEAL